MTAPFLIVVFIILPAIASDIEHIDTHILGQYFGQKYFLTKQRRVRSATVRVPFDSVSVDIACLMPEQFSIWDSYRNVLLGKRAGSCSVICEQDRTESSAVQGP